MKSLEIKVIKKNNIEAATIEYDKHTCTLHITFANQTQKKYSSPSIFHSFGLLRKDFNDIKFLCKGAKINVHTSGMSSQMSNGLVAYELTMGQPDGELVHIFTYEENDLTNDIQEQHDFCQRWAESV